LRKGRELPQWYLNEPPIGPLDDFYINAFWELSTTRRYEMGYIPWDIIQQYALLFGLDEFNTKLFTLIIRAMDSKILEQEAKEQKRHD
jgi:hypothetical protein